MAEPATPLAQEEAQAAKSALLKQIVTALKDGSLELPSLPDIALEVRSVATMKDLNVADLAKVVRQDPGLSAYLIKLSNSAHYTRARPVETLEAAITRLGIDATRDYASSYAIKTLFSIRDATIRGHMRQVWHRGVHTAALASVMAERCGFLPERATLAGLMQDIGALPLLARLAEYPELAARPALVKELLDGFTGKISGIILNAWGFDNEMVVVGLERENWMRDTRGQADLADLMLVARYHSYIGTPDFKKLPSLGSVPAFQKLALGDWGPQEGLAFLREAKKEVEAMRQALQ